MESSAKKPLCVDLDGTLVLTDTLVESLFALLRQNVLFLFLLPLWLLRGKAAFKAEVARRISLDAEALPYAPELLQHLRERREAGERLVLVTASDRRAADTVAGHLGLFDDVLASDGEVNLKGRRKAEFLQQRYGNPGFDYAGNSMADLPVWQAADEAIVVNPDRGVLAAARRKANVTQVFDQARGGRLAALFRGLRPHQWLKNLLVFVPLMTAHRFTEADLLLQALIAFGSFGLCASSVYLLNDLLDLPDDRRHPVKRSRPFASGAVPLQWGIVAVPLLLLASVVLALTLPPVFLYVLGVYYVATLAYSLRLKRSAVVDVITLAGLYTLRIIAGAAAVMVAPSFWLLAFSMFLFLSLALVKRYAELYLMQKSQREQAAGRGYQVSDLEALAQFGSASGFLAVLVLALYINSDKVSELYRHPQLIWLLCPLLLYLLMRVWLLARRGAVLEDPVIFFVRDRLSQVLAVLGVLLLWLAA